MEVDIHVVLLRYILHHRQTSQIGDQSLLLMEVKMGGGNAILLFIKKEESNPLKFN